MKCLELDVFSRTLLALINVFVEMKNPVLSIIFVACSHTVIPTVFDFYLKKYLKTLLFIFLSKRSRIQHLSKKDSFSQLKDPLSVSHTGTISIQHIFVKTVYAKSLTVSHKHKISQRSSQCNYPN